jgi:hypothetical protein
MQTAKPATLEKVQTPSTADPQPLAATLAGFSLRVERLAEGWQTACVGVLAKWVDGMARRCGVWLVGLVCGGGGSVWFGSDFFR